MLGYLSKLAPVGVFNGAGSAGPRRLLMLFGSAALIVAVILGVSAIQTPEPPISRPGRLPKVDPLPGGLNSNSQQDKLGVLTNQEQAKRADVAGHSFTPVMPASQAYVEPPDVPPARQAPAVALAATPAPPPPAAPVNTPRPRAPVPTVTAPTIRATPIAATTTVAQQAPSRTPQDEAALKAQLDKMMAGWSGRPPRTDIVLPPDDPQADNGQSTRVRDRRRSSGSVDVVADPPVTPAAASQAIRQRVLVPAGRGVYAHTILAANSDAQSPVVLQGDSGPLVGDRMIGTFERQRDRLVIRIDKVIHQGEEIGTEGLVVAPETMEVGVASSVDQNYLSRFLLPAAAAFVQGLGQAIAQSNSTSVLGPLGTATVQNRLNFQQQLGVGAGVAAAQIGSTLAQSAPKGPTVILAVGSSVGVMFLTNVATKG